MASEDARRDAEDVTELDLVPPELLAPRLRLAGLVFVVLGAGVGTVLGVLVSSIGVGILFALAVVVPCVLSIALTARRRTWIIGSRVHQRSRFGTRTVDFADAVSVEFLVRGARVSQVLIRVGDGKSSATLGLALYTDRGGRELQPIGLRKLANALSAAQLAPAVSAASLLIEQLRAEARDASLPERPLFRAVTLAIESGRTPQTVLTDREVAELAD